MQNNPRLSVIVPVYDVEEFLAECLDSILAQDFDDFELIAVDDCSPDGCADILRKYEQADDRVRILSLKRNVGLGGARNAGLEIARGEYVWFIDSDDVLCPNKLATLMERAEETKADVVLFAFVRFFEDGTEKGGGRSDLLGRAPDLFTASEWPRILKVIQVAWNKLIRRDLLERTHLRFPDGYYEDTAFTYPLLASARSITTVPEVVVRYRQRTGAITATRSERHFEVFDQWTRAMEKLPEVDKDGKLQAALFPVMIRHCTYIMIGGHRIAADRQPEYMRRLHSLFQAHRPPAGYNTRTMGEKVELGIVRIGSLPILKLFWNVRSAWWSSLGRKRVRPARFKTRGLEKARTSVPSPRSISSKG
jgi:CDP-glycerol glycerophosphotransferase